AMIGQLPTEAELVFQEKTSALNCPTVWVKPAKRLTENKAIYQDIDYTLIKILVGMFFLVSKIILRKFSSNTFKPIKSSGSALLTALMIV
ncbi:MAG: hypothetical protein AB4058_04535, partial [Microcystaceae cyanobacterium]